MEIQEVLRILETFPAGPQGQKHFWSSNHDDIDLFSVILSLIFWGDSQRSHGMWYHNTLNGEMHMRIQQSSMKPDIK